MKKQLTEELITFRNLIAELVDVPAVHCHEEEMMRLMRDRFSDTADQVEVDLRGNVHGTFEGSGEGKELTLMLAAHTDGIGLIVKHIDKNGFIWFDGNALGQALASRRVWIHGTKGPVLAVTSVKLGYGISTQEERKAAATIRDTYIDAGCCSREEAAELGIEIGQPITYYGKLESMNNPFLVVSPILDDRAGCAVLLSLAKQIKDINPRPTVVLVGTVEEEIGTRGASTAAARIQPDIAISVDTQAAGGTPDVPEHILPINIGIGPVIKHHEGFTRCVHPRVKQLLFDGAKAAGEKYQTAAVPPGGSDMGVMEQSGHGVPVGAIAIPRRFPHSPNEIIDIRDAFGIIGILRESIRILGKGYSLNRI
jgi:putative aminopeptidase